MRIEAALLTRQGDGAASGTGFWMILRMEKGTEDAVPPRWHSVHASTMFLWISHSVQFKMHWRTFQWNFLWPSYACSYMRTEPFEFLAK